MRLRGSRAGRAFWQERSGEEVALGVGRGEGARGGVGVCREQRSLWALCRVGLPGGEGSWEPRAGVQCPHRASLLPFPLSQPCLGSPCWVGPSHWLGKLWTRAGAQLVGDEGVGGRGDVGHGVGSVSAERPGRRAEVSGSQRERAPKRLPCLHVCLCYRRSLQPKHKPPKSNRTFPIILPPEEAWLTMPMARGSRRPAVP